MARQRRTRPLHPCKVSDYTPTTTSTTTFSFEARNFFVQPDLLRSAYPYDPGVKHPKGYKIHYFEFRGLGPPPDDLGLPGDVWIDRTPSHHALYSREGAKWSLWPASCLVEKLSVSHPFIPARMLWCTDKAVAWYGPATIQNHWGRLKKSKHPPTAGTLNQMLSAILHSGDASKVKAPDREIVCVKMMRNKMTLISYNVGSSQESSILAEAPSRGLSFIGSSTDRVDKYQSSTSTTDSSPLQSLSPPDTSACDLVSEQSTPDGGQLMCIVSDPEQVDSSENFRPGPIQASLRSGENDSMSIGDDNTPISDYSDAELSSLSEDEISTPDPHNQHTTQPLMQEELNTNRTLQTLSDDHHPASDSPLPPSLRRLAYHQIRPPPLAHTLPDLHSPPPALQSNSAHLESTPPSPASLDEIYRSTSIADEPQPSPAHSITRIQEGNDQIQCAYPHEEQFQPLLEKTRLLETDILFLKDADRRLHKGGMTRTDEQTNDTVVDESIQGLIHSLFSRAQISSDIDIIEPMFRSLVQGISLFSARVQAERAAHSMTKRRLEETQAMLKQYMHPEPNSDSGNNDVVATSSTSISMDISSPSQSVGVEATVSLSETRSESDTPGNFESDLISSPGAALAPTPLSVDKTHSSSAPFGQTDADHSSDSTLIGDHMLLASSSAIRDKASNNSTWSVKPGQRSSDTLEDGQEMRPAKRRRISCDPESCPNSGYGDGSEHLELVYQPYSPTLHAVFSPMDNLYEENNGRRDRVEGNSPLPSNYKPGQMGKQHLEILFLSHRNQRHCRSCLLRQLQYPSFTPLAFPSDTSITSLVAHCESEHPIACEKLVGKHIQELVEIRNQVETTDWRLLNTAVEEDDNDDDIDDLRV